MLTRTCPKCHSSEPYRYGFEPKTDYQRYRCRHCQTQFVFEREPQSKNSPADHGLCPDCSHKLHIRKRNKTTLQLRCSNRKHCFYSVSVPLFPVDRVPDDLYPFPKFLRFPFAMFLKAIELHFKFFWSSRQIKQELHRIYKKSPSHTTINHWCLAFAALLYRYCHSELRSLNHCVSKWHIDETAITIFGRKLHLFTVLDASSRFILAFHLSYTKSYTDAYQAFSNALEFTGYPPQIIISDGASAFALASQKLFGDTVIHEVVSLYSSNTDRSNNLLERSYSTVKEPFSHRKYSRSFASAMLSCFVRIFVYNFLRPHSAFSAPPNLVLNYLPSIKNPILEAFVKCFI